MHKFNEIIKSRGLVELPYQKDFLTNPIYEKVSKPVVFAAGTSAGKTFTMAMWLEIFYSNIKNKNKSTLIIPASKTVLRDNTSNSLEEFNPSFTYRVCKDNKELKDAIDDKVQVIIALPQTLIRSINILPKFERFILDEAHQWYFKTTIQSLIKKIKPNYQLLLTGSPSRFVAQKDKFICKFVPVMELYELGHVHNAKIEVVSSSYDFKQTDWLSSYGNLKSSKTNSAIEAKASLEKVIDEMITKLKSTTDSKVTRNWKGLNKINAFFNHLSKTIIYTHSTKQANTFFEILNKKMNGNVLLSHSENDGNSEMFNQFQNDDKIKILVAVDRGRLGFNMPELFNIVDFTMTQSLDMLLQMYGRLLRKSTNNTDKQKIYFKVATKNTADYFLSLMNAMMLLTTNYEPTYYYSSYNGKNMGGIRIPKALISNKKIKTNGIKQINKSNCTKPYVSLAELGIPTDLNLFKQSVLHSSDGLFDSIGWTTLDDVKKEFFEINRYTFEEVKDAISNCNSMEELENQYKWALTYARRYGYHNLFEHLKTFNTIDFNSVKKTFLEWTGTKKEFTIKNRSYEGWARRNGYYDEWTKHFLSGRWTGKYTNINEVKKYIKKNNISSEFELKSKNRAMHVGLVRNGIIKKIF